MTIPSRRRPSSGREPTVRLVAGAVALLLVIVTVMLAAFSSRETVTRVVPVAVVNMDALVPADEGSDLPPVAAGRQLAAELVAPEPSGVTILDWSLSSEEAAAAGLDSGEFYAVVTIPEDFSQSIASLGGDDPHAATLSIESNDTSSRFVGAIGDQAVAEAANTLGTSVTVQYLDATFLAVDGMGAAFEESATGAGDLAGGASDLADGAQAVADGAVEVSDAAGELAAGTASLTDATTDVSDGARTVADGAAELATATEALATGAAAVSGAAADLGGGASAVSDGADDLARAMSETISVMAADTADASLATATSAAAVAAACPASAGAAYCAQVSALAAAAGQTARDAATTSAATAGAASSSQTLAASALSLAAGSEAFAAQAAAVALGAQDVAGAAAELAAGADDLASGASRTASGADETTAGAATLTTGADELSSAAVELAAGASSLADSTEALASGMSDASSAVPDYSDAGDREALAEAVAQPVEIHGSAVDDVDPWYSTLLAIAVGVGLWLSLTMVFAARPVVPAWAVAARTSRVRAVGLGVFPGMALVGALTVALAVALPALDVDAGAAGAFLGLALLGGLSLAALHQALRVLAEARAFAVGAVLLVVQIVSIAAVLPVESAPAFIQWCNASLPVPVLVDALQHTVAAGGPPAAGGNAVAVLVAWGLGSVLVSAVHAGRRLRVDAGSILEKKAARA